MVIRKTAFNIPHFYQRNCNQQKCLKTLIFKIRLIVIKSLWPLIDRWGRLGDQKKKKKVIHLANMKERTTASRQRVKIQGWKGKADRLPARPWHCADCDRTTKRWEMSAQELWQERPPDVQNDGTPPSLKLATSGNWARTRACRSEQGLCAGGRRLEGAWQVLASTEFFDLILLPAQENFNCKNSLCFNRNTYLVTLFLIADY